MTPKDKIQQEIEQTLKSLDGVKRAGSNAFLFTRIKARMEKRSGAWEWITSFVSRPLIAIAIVVLVMAINGWALWDSNSEEIVTADNNSELANEYNTVASVNNYDYENMTNE
jgi:hypothetical protein